MKPVIYKHILRLKAATRVDGERKCFLLGRKFLEHESSEREFEVYLSRSLP